MMDETVNINYTRMGVRYRYHNMYKENKTDKTVGSLKYIFKYRGIKLTTTDVNTI